MSKPKVANDRMTIAVHVPISIRKRGGRKIILAPDGSRSEAPGFRLRSTDHVMVKALARAFRWRRLIEDGEFATITEIAAAEGLDHSYVGRIMRMTLVAPDIVEAIVEGRQPATLTLGAFSEPFPVEWNAQRSTLGLQIELR
jgi:hypothetical protein